MEAVYAMKYDDLEPINIENMDYTKNQIQPPIPQSFLNAEQEGQRILDDINEFHRERKQNEKRKHDELIGVINQIDKTIKESTEETIKMDSSVSINANYSVVNLSQNSQGTRMEGTVSSECDYDSIEKILSEIKEYLELPQFSDDFGENSELVKKTVEETLVATCEKKSPKIIQKGLKILRSVAEGVTESFIAAGIVGMLDKIPLFFA